MTLIFVKGLHNWSGISNGMLEGPSSGSGVLEVRGKGQTSDWVLWIGSKTLSVVKEHREQETARGRAEMSEYPRQGAHAQAIGEESSRREWARPYKNFWAMQIKDWGHFLSVLRKFSHVLCYDLICIEKRISQVNKITRVVE